jgi:hypothetical protein
LRHQRVILVVCPPLRAAASRHDSSRWQSLTHYVDDGQFESIRTPSNVGGERAAAVYSLLGSAKLSGFSPPGTKES